MTFTYNLRGFDASYCQMFISETFPMELKSLIFAYFRRDPRLLPRYSGHQEGGLPRSRLHQGVLLYWPPVQRSDKDHRIHLHSLRHPSHRCLMDVGHVNEPIIPSLSI